MFTGIIAAIGQIRQITPLAASTEAGVRLQIDAGQLSLDDVVIGDSIAVNGACMTVVAFDSAAATFTVDVSRESLNKTTGLDAIGYVNLEKAMRLSDRLGGHLVSGHVDDVAQIVRMTAVGESCELVFAVDARWQGFLADKGSVTLSGVSLTVNRVWQEPAHPQKLLGSINLIPHTVANTIFQFLHAGDTLNFEVDLLARYVAQLLQRPA